MVIDSNDVPFAEVLYLVQLELNAHIPEGAEGSAVTAGEVRTAKGGTRAGQGLQLSGRCQPCAVCLDFFHFPNHAVLAIILIPRFPYSA